MMGRLVKRKSAKEALASKARWPRQSAQKPDVGGECSRHRLKMCRMLLCQLEAERKGKR